MKTSGLRMRVAILGAGAMGSWFGGHLAFNGLEVHLLTTNEAHIDAVEKDGLELIRGDSSVTVQVPICKPEALVRPVDLVIALTKTFQLETALDSIKRCIEPDTIVLSLQNGLGNAEAIASRVGWNNTWLGTTMLPVDRLAPGVVEGTGNGITWFGQTKESLPSVAEHLQALFTDSGLDVRYDKDILVRIWQKVAFNSGMNAVCALTHATPGGIGASEDAKNWVKTVAAESVSVAHAMGVAADLKSVMDTIDYACEHHGGHQPSMLQDLLNSKQTEVLAINGAIVQFAQQCGIEAPLNAHLATLVQLAEVGHADQPRGLLKNS